MRSDRDKLLLENSELEIERSKLVEKVSEIQEENAILHKERAIWLEAERLETCVSLLQHSNTLQHTATHCITLQYTRAP